MRGHKKAGETVQRQTSRRIETQKSIVAIVAVIAVLIVFWLSAVPAVNWYERSGQLGQLREARARWDAGRVQNYDFDYLITCLCSDATPAPVTVSVRGGDFSNAVMRRDGVVIDASARSALARTIDEAFDVVPGFPAAVRAAFAQDVEGDEVGYYVSRFRSLEDEQ
jgi:hypothetical protein